MERGEGPRITSQRRLQELYRLDGVVGGETLARAGDVGIGAALRAVRVEPGDQRARKAEHAPGLFVADLGALVPGAIGFDHAAVREDDGVGAGGPGEGEPRQRRHHGPARPRQGSSSAALITRGVAPPFRK